MTTKPQSLQIADDLDMKQRLAYLMGDACDPCSPEAALIRQQHAAIVALTEALQYLLNNPTSGLWHNAARAAIIQHGAKQ